MLLSILPLPRTREDHMFDASSVIVMACQGSCNVGSLALWGGSKARALTAARGCDAERESPAQAELEQEYAGVHPAPAGHNSALPARFAKRAYSTAPPPRNDAGRAPLDWHYSPTCPSIGRLSS
eukprot:3133073-Amphidinium_carterae.1